MTRKPIPKTALVWMMSVALVLTVALVVLLVTGHVLGKMGDATGQSVLDAIALAGGLLWAVNIICLVFALGVNAIGDDDHSSSDDS